MFVVIGSGENGRSKVVERRDDDPDGRSETLWKTEHYPPEVPVARRAPDDEVEDLHVGSTGTRWVVARLPAGRPARLHRTDTLDYDVILAGEVTLVLEDGEVLLRPGDRVVIPGLLHGWRAGPAGCTFSAVVLGLAPVT